MNWTVNKNPEKDGKYILAVRMSGSWNIEKITYTVEGGWNTTRLANGTLCDEHSFGQEPFGWSVFHTRETENDIWMWTCFKELEKESKACSTGEKE